MKIPRKFFNDSFYPLLTSDKRYIVLYGSRGSSKSEFVAQWCILRSMCKGYFKMIYCRKHQEHIRETQFSSLKKWIKAFGLSHCFRIYEGTMRIDNIVTGNTLIAKGIDNPEKVKSLDDPSHVWFEEVTEFNQADFASLNGSIRTEKCKPQAILTFNPIDESHWVREMFFDDKDISKPNKRFGDDIVLHHSTFRDNRFINQETYYQTLLINSLGRENYMRVNAEGNWGVAEVKNAFMYCWDESLVEDIGDVDPRQTVFLAFDFNVDPITCSVHQYGNGWYYTLDEFRLNDANTYKLCEAINAKYGHCHIRVTGDVSGRARKSSSKLTDFQIIEQEIKPAKIDIARVNPPLDQSRTLSNQILARHPKRRFHPRCKHLIEDMRLVQYENGAIVKRGDSRLTHLLDGQRYMDWTYFQDFIEKQQRK